MEGVTVTVSGTTITITAEEGVDSIVFSFSAQARAKSFEITYEA